MSYPAGHWKDLADFPAAQPPGADSANVPTQESWTSDRKQAQLSQGHARPGLLWTGLTCVVWTARGRLVTSSPWRLSSQGFYCVFVKPDGLVCLQHRLVAAVPRPSTCRVPFRQFPR